MIASNGESINFNSGNLNYYISGIGNFYGGTMISSSVLNLLTIEVLAPDEYWSSGGDEG